MKTQEVTQKIQDFIKGGDNSDLELLENTLHKNYRNVQSGFFDKKGLFNFPKEKYKSLIQERTFGGVPRTMEIIQLDIMENIAYAQVKLESSALKFRYLIVLVKDADKWWVIGNYPSIKQL